MLLAFNAMKILKKNSFFRITIFVVLLLQDTELTIKHNYGQIEGFNSFRDYKFQICCRFSVFLYLLCNTCL